jgi:hypothetical protein
MMSVEERLAHVEGLVGGQAQLLGDLRAAVTSFEGRVDRRFDQVDTRLTQMDGRFTIIEGRLTALDQKLDLRSDALNAKVDALGHNLRREMSGQFRWTMGLMVTLMTVVLGAVLAR